MKNKKKKKKKKNNLLMVLMFSKFTNQIQMLSIHYSNMPTDMIEYLDL